jgi:hypothetical protein
MRTRYLKIRGEDTSWKTRCRRHDNLKMYIEVGWDGMGSGYGWAVVNSGSVKGASYLEQLSFRQDFAPWS